MRYLILLLAFLVAIPAGAQKKGKAKKQAVPFALWSASGEYKQYIKGFDITKGEFEKTVQYEARMQRYADNRPEICVVVGAMCYAGQNTYHADEEILSVIGGCNIPTAKRHFKGGDDVIELEYHTQDGRLVEYNEHYALKITNVERLRELGLTLENVPQNYSADYTAIKYNIPVVQSKALIAKISYRIVLCLKMAGQDKTQFYEDLGNGTHDFKKNKSEIPVYYAALAEVVGFKVVDFDNSIILEKHLPQ